MGADKVIDYTMVDFTKHGETYDVIFDIVGQSSYSDCMRLLKGNVIITIDHNNKAR